MRETDQDAAEPEEGSVLNAILNGCPFGSLGCGRSAISRLKALLLLLVSRFGTHLKTIMAAVPNILARTFGVCYPIRAYSLPGEARRKGKILRYAGFVLVPLADAEDVKVQV